jgi:hypothetical protein
LPDGGTVADDPRLHVPDTLQLPQRTERHFTMLPCNPAPPEPDAPTNRQTDGTACPVIEIELTAQRSRRRRVPYSDRSARPEVWVCRSLCSLWTARRLVDAPRGRRPSAQARRARTSTRDPAMNDLHPGAARVGTTARRETRRSHLLSALL